MPGPLDGVKVLDLAQLTSAPMAAMVMAEQGAEVIKVESPPLGDLYRVAAFNKGGITSLFANQNRGKRSISIDASSDDGLAVLLDLLEWADVVFQNFRPGVVDRMGIGYEAAKARNPGVIYVSISGYGPDGPYANRPVVDPIIQSLSGIVARQQSEAIPLPDLVRQIMVDKATALQAAQAVCASLYHREKTGEGDHLVLPMLDMGVSFFWPDGMMDHTLLDDDVNAGLRIADTYQLTNCSDGQIIYYAPSDAHRHALFRALGHPELCEDPRFKDAAGLVQPGNWEALGAIIVNAFYEKTVDEVLTQLVELEVPCAPILEPEQVFDDPQIVHNETLVTWTHPVAGTLRQPRHPVRFANHDTPIPERIDLLGESTEDVLAMLGRTADDIAALRDAGVID